MDSNAIESWVYKLFETELRSFANALNINAAVVVLILRDCIVRYTKKRWGNENIPRDTDDTIDASLPLVRRAEFADEGALGKLE